MGIDGPSNNIALRDVNSRSLAEHAAEIRRLGKRVAAGVIEIGRRLVQCKWLIGHGSWQTWLEHEFGWSEATALRFMQVHALAGKSVNLTDLELPVSALYLLPAPSTPEEARDEIIKTARTATMSGGLIDSASAGGHQELADNPMDQDLATRLSNLRLAPRCGARTRAGTACQRPAIRGQKRCRLHGGLSPGAPRGVRNGNFKNGDWTKDAIAERKWVRSLQQPLQNGQSAMNERSDSPKTVGGQRRLPPVRVKLLQAYAYTEETAPPDGESKDWWSRLNKALGTVSTDFVRASLLQLQGAARSPYGTISETAINAALAMIEAVAPMDELEAALAVQMACTHTAAMAVLAKMDSGFGSDRHIAAFGSTAARLMKAYAMQMEVLRRLRGGGQQLVRVEHVHINDGGQAAIGNVITPGSNVSPAT